MSGGVIPSEAFNEQLKRTVRETMRREHSTQRPRARWHKKGSGGGGGASSGCACDCVVVNPNLLHWGNFPTVFEWQVSISNTTPLELVTAGNGWVRLTSGDYTVLWNEVQGKWSNGDITASLEFFDSDLDAVTPSSATGTLTVEWESSSGDFIALFEFDGVIP